LELLLAASDWWDPLLDATNIVFLELLLSSDWRNLLLDEVAGAVRRLP
jgi:hypothetical protein